MRIFLASLLVFSAALANAQEHKSAPTDNKVEIEKIMATSCVSCHSGEKAKGGLTLDNYEVVLKEKKEIVKYVTKGKMPPKNPHWHKSAEGKRLIELLR